MTLLKPSRPLWIGAAALFAIVFGVLTLISGGSVLFTEQGRQTAGNYVAFVVWFNFLAGFAYVIAGVGLWQQQRWAVWLSLLIAGTTLVVFVVFGLHALMGGSYETRTVGAMSLRTVVWFVISIIAYRQLNPKSSIVNRKS
jgi:uncharacterized membrane protein (DUF2068 family)